MTQEAEIAGRVVAEGEAEAGGVRALERGLRVLSCFNVGRPRWALSDLSQAAGLHKATTRRIVKTLETQGFLDLDEADGVYHLGKALLPLTYVARFGDELVQAARPFIKRLAILTGETVGLSVWTDTGVAQLDLVFTSHVFKPDLMRGEIDSVYGAADSKVFLAFGPQARFARLVAPDGESDLTVAYAESLDEDLECVRARGVAYDFEERLTGVCSLAVPVRDRRLEVVASISVVVPPERFGVEERERIARLATESADSLSRQLELPSASQSGM